MDKKYFIVINQDIVASPYGKDSLYPGITLIQEKQEQKFLEEFSDLDIALMFIRDACSAVTFVENYQGTGNLHAMVKEYILYERNDDCTEAEAIGYSQMPK